MTTTKFVHHQGETGRDPQILTRGPVTSTVNVTNGDGRRVTWIVPSSLVGHVYDHDGLPYGHTVDPVTRKVHPPRTAPIPTGIDAW